jgi:hypothetical protein
VDGVAFVVSQFKSRHAWVRRASSRCVAQGHCWPCAPSCVESKTSRYYIRSVGVSRTVSHDQIFFRIFHESVYVFWMVNFTFEKRNWTKKILIASQMCFECKFCQNMFEEKKWTKIILLFKRDSLSANLHNNQRITTWFASVKNHRLGILPDVSFAYYKSDTMCVLSIHFRPTPVHCTPLHFLLYKFQWTRVIRAICDQKRKSRTKIHREISSLCQKHRLLELNEWNLYLKTR